MKKHLIINADDFGMHHAVNEAVEMAYRKGILTSASLAINGGSADEALKIAGRNAGLGIGIHLTLNGEKPASEPGNVSTLLEDGHLIESHCELFKKTFFGQIDKAHIRNEFRSQLEKFLKTGLVPTHLDSHRHVHLFPPIFEIVQELLTEFGIRKIRWIGFSPLDFFTYSPKHFLFLCLIIRNRANLKTGVVHPDSYLGFARSDSLDMDYMRRILPRLPAGMTEIGFHPGTDNSALRRHYHAWTEKHQWNCDWEGQLALLTDPECRALIKENGIGLVNYGAL